MNTFKKLILATLILGASSQAINAHPWSTKAIAAATLAGLGLGATGAVKYYGFNTITNAVLEKCAKAKNWLFDSVSNKISNMIYGSHNQRIQKLNQIRSEILTQADLDKNRLELENSKLKTGAQQSAQLSAQHAKNVQFSTQQRTLELAKKLKVVQQQMDELKKDATQMRYDVIMELKQFHDQITHLIKVAPQMTAEYFEENATSVNSSNSFENNSDDGFVHLP